MNTVPPTSVDFELVDELFEGSSSVKRMKLETRFKQPQAGCSSSVGMVSEPRKEHPGPSSVYKLMTAPIHPLNPSDSDESGEGAVSPSQDDGDYPVQQRATTAVKKERGRALVKTRRILSSSSSSSPEPAPRNLQSKDPPAVPQELSMSPTDAEMASIACTELLLEEGGPAPPKVQQPGIGGVQDGACKGDFIAPHPPSQKGTSSMKVDGPQTTRKRIAPTPLPQGPPVGRPAKKSRSGGEEEPLVETYKKSYELAGLLKSLAEKKKMIAMFNVQVQEDRRRIEELVPDVFNRIKNINKYLGCNVSQVGGGLSDTPSSSTGTESCSAGRMHELCTPVESGGASEHNESAGPSEVEGGSVPMESGGASEHTESDGEQGLPIVQVGGNEPSSESDGDEVYIERLRRWERPFERYRSLMISEEFRFNNLNSVSSFAGGISALTRGVQEVLNDLQERLDDGDAVQLRLEGGGLANPFFSFKKHKGHLDATDFLDSVVAVLQSNREILANETLRLVVTIIRPQRGGARRAIGTVPYSLTVTKKRRHLIDFGAVSPIMCFAGGLMGLLLMGRGNSPTAQDLMQAAEKLHVEMGWAVTRQVGFDDISTVERHLRVNIHVVHNTANGWGIFKTGDGKYTDTYHMLLHDHHYYGIINIKAVMGVDNYCHLCSTLYHHKHQCSKFCQMCGTVECKLRVGGVPKRCPNCCVYTSSKACLEKHLARALKGEVNCLSRKWCKKCRSFQAENHVQALCRGRKCRACEGMLGGEEEVGAVEDEHLCYVEPLHEIPKPVHYVYYDFECRQETGQHIPNYLYARASKEPRDWKYAGQSWEFWGETCAYDFVLMITADSAFHRCTFIAHNAKAYDSYFIVRELIAEKLDPTLLAVGGKLLCVTVPKKNIKFIDSLNHLPMALAKLPKAMGFEECKGYFPHYFNTVENQSYVGPLPDPHFYGVENMKPSEREVFLKWHSEHKNDTFDFEKELAYYCQMDVRILEKACTVYREEIMQLTQREGVGSIDPLQQVTLAGVCLAMYRFMHLRPKTIAIPPPDHYHKRIKRYSSAAIQWLCYLEHTENISIRHALKGGEYRVGRRYLDGYAVKEGKQIAFEFLGCYWHGCPECYSPGTVNKMMGKPYGILYGETQSRTDYLKDLGFEVRSIWEHEWMAMKKNDRGVQAFLEERGFPEPLVPRDALFGGRTNAIKLYHKVEEGEKMFYVDFTSLYPFVNKVKFYPVGHPTIITDNFGPITDYFGFAKLKLHPPRGLFFPVLPCKIDGKLIFTLCTACARNKQQEPCAHDLEERMVSGTWCTVEIEEALARGYRVAQISEVWHFEEKSDQIFSEYINMHLRQKQEASGYPSWCKSDEDRQRYIEEYFKKEGILLRHDHIEYNPSRRQIAKLFLNSLWGKFAQRSNLPTTEIVREPDRLFQLVFSDNYETCSCDFIDEDAACVSWKYSKERLVTGGKTSVYIAAYTTAYGRLELYKLLHRLGERCVYHDTDSVIYSSWEGVWNPPLGDYLGELTSELPPGEHITEFVSTGPKSYGYRLSGGGVNLKVKGITLNSENCAKVNFDTLKDLVFTHQAGEGEGTITLQNRGIVRNKRDFTIETKVLTKTHRVVYDKRVLVDGFRTLPYGY